MILFDWAICYNVCYVSYIVCTRSSHNAAFPVAVGQVMIDRTFLERKRENSLYILFCFIQARSTSTVVSLGSASEYWGGQICKPECDCCIILFLFI